MNKFALVSLTTAAGALAWMGITAARFQPTVRANTYVGPVAVGGLSPEEASRKLRVWWEGEKRLKLKIHAGHLSKGLSDRTPGELGVTLDDVASVSHLPMEDLGGSVSDALGRTIPERSNFDPVYRSNGVKPSALLNEINQLAPRKRPARVRFDKTIVIEPEVSAWSLDPATVEAAVENALKLKADVELPLQEAPKAVSEETLGKIKDVVAEFTTHFSTLKRTRCSNIRLASRKIDGAILMPGERLSFNHTVGRRTLKAGFLMAGVYKNGKHDTGIGGGICQVSTTLYNASLFANLKVRERENHSLPVPYVPLGRDATVDYGSLDLVIENSYPTPIAIASQYRPGSLTFRILGTKPEGQSIRIVQSGLRSWPKGTKTVVDRTLRQGRSKIVDRGSQGHVVVTYRLVFQNGKLERKEYLGRSFYGAADQIIATNPRPRATLPPATIPVRPSALGG